MTKPVDRPHVKSGPKPSRPPGKTVGIRLFDFEVAALDKLVEASKEPTTRSTLAAQFVSDTLVARALI